MHDTHLPYNSPTTLLQTSFIKSDGPESSDPTPQNRRGPSPPHALLTRVLLSPFLTRIPPITLLTRILLSLARRRRRTLTPPPSPYPTPSAIATPPCQQRPSLLRRPASPTSSISSAPPPEPISPVRIATDGRSPICSASVDLSRPHRHRWPPLPISSVPKVNFCSQEFDQVTN
jgi:hypothetical protein